MGLVATFLTSSRGSTLTSIAWSSARSRLERFEGLPFDERTIYWPTAKTFALEKVAAMLAP